MRIFFDTEFVDTGSRIILISIGMVREDGRELYIEVESPETLKNNPDVSDWVKKNVFPHLSGGPLLYSRRTAALDIVRFAGEKPEFWAYVADYDWVALSQLYGALIQRPKGWPWTALDAYQLPDFKQYEVKAENAHNAIADALALKLSWDRWRAAWPDFALPKQSSPSDKETE